MLFSPRSIHLQVVNADDLEDILGPRPFRSVELRNIDKFREGFGKKQDLVDEPQKPPTPGSDQATRGVVDVPQTEPGASGGISIEKPGGRQAAGGIVAS